MFTWLWKARPKIEISHKSDRSNSRKPKMKSHLKVKVYSLTTEMSYIRRQEEKWKNRARAARLKQKQHAEQTHIDHIAYATGNFWTLRAHRTELKREARSTHLAYGFLKGRLYGEMEIICHGLTPGYNREAPDWQRIQDMVERFSKDEPDNREIMQRFGEWLADAKVWYEGNPKRIELRAAVKEEWLASEEWKALKEVRAERAMEARERALAKAKAAA